MSALWMPSDVEREAIWELVGVVRGQYGLSEAEAVLRVVEMLGAEGRVVDEGVIFGCRPGKRGAVVDSHVHDIGKALAAQSLELEAPMESDDVSAWVEDFLLKLEARGDGFFARLREVVAMPVVSAIFQRCLPRLPEVRLVRCESSIYVRDGEGIEAVSLVGGVVVRKVAGVEAGEEFLMESDEDAVGGMGVLWVRGLEGERVGVKKGAVRLVDRLGKVVRVIPEARVRGMAVELGDRRKGKRYFLSMWRPDPKGVGDWEFGFRKFVTLASLFSRGVVEDVTGAALADLLGETRAAISKRRRGEMEMYRERTGGVASFPGMRAGVDPRKGIKTGPRVKAGE